MYNSTRKELKKVLFNSKRKKEWIGMNYWKKHKERVPKIVKLSYNEDEKKKYAIEMKEINKDATKLQHDETEAVKRRIELRKVLNVDIM